MNKFCVICGKELIGRQRKLCSDKECRKKRKSEWDHKYYLNNQERIKRNTHKYYQDNQEKMRDHNRNYSYVYRQNNQEKIKEQQREYCQNNPKKVKEYKHEYYQNNLEMIKENGHKRYRRSRGLPEDADLHKESSIERIIREWLQKNNIEFIAQYYINFENSTWTYVDFYIHELNICLYCDGNYYHLFPNVKKCDANQNRILPQMGYKVIRLSEAEILNGNRPWELNDRSFEE